MSRHSLREKSMKLIYQIEDRDGNVHKLKEVFNSKNTIENSDDRSLMLFLEALKRMNVRASSLL